MSKCQGCGAELATATLCNYCGSRQDVDLKGIHDYSESRLNSNKNCPCCAVPMRTINIGDDDTLFIEQCQQCFGLFFGIDELETLLDKTKKTYNIQLDLINKLAQNSTSLNREIVYRKCPVCKTLMNRKNYGGRSGIITDVCRDHGIWLDSGELRSLMEWKRAGGELLKKRIEKNSEKRKENQQKRENRPSNIYKRHTRQVETRHNDNILDAVLDLFRSIW